MRSCGRLLHRLDRSLLLGPLLWLAAGCGGAAPDRPAVLLVVLDTVRADRTSLGGHVRPTTRTLEELAETSLVFEDAASTASWTLPAHASLFTGLYPYEHGVRWGSDPLPGSQGVEAWSAPLSGEATTLAEVFRDAGYHTFGVTSNYGLTESLGFTQGFDAWEIPAAPPGRPKRYAIGPRVVDAAIRRLEAAGDAPFLGFVNLMDAHAPYLPEPGEERFSANGAGSREGLIYTNGLRTRVNLHERLPSPEAQERLLALYDDEILYADAQLRRLVDFLRESGRLDDTILVVVSDHGESFFAHGLVNHGIGVYEETLRVPLLIRHPPSVPAGRVGERVELIDVFPTLLGLAGLEADVVPTFAVDLLDPEARHRGRAALAENYPNELGTARPAVLRTTRALVLDGWKYIEVSDGPGGPELYDLNADPDEQVNLAGRQAAAEVEARLRAELGRLTAAPAAEPAPSATLSPEEREHLRALGYLGEPE